ncbi:probable aspartic proteinase GIP2 [Ziziphus jujuba]|uniref:Probable aspartic proteinase GIP2 n=1 Tax=Ziziphus jujuba TaxID=326968 RepID=A0A6P4A0R8_ZIZJJ|nr:probable aspartic proteinase GIP2 [Ziziphus jujuba]
MGCCSHFNFLFLCFLLILSNIISTSIAKKSSSSHPPIKTLVLPVTKVHYYPGPDQYVIKIKQRTPLLPIKLTIDLGLDNPFMHCDQAYVSSTYKPINCSSPVCSYANYPFEYCSNCPNGGVLNTPGCHDNTCQAYSINNISGRPGSGELFQDIVSVKSINGRSVSVPNFLFICSHTGSLLKLANDVQGMAAFGVSNISFPYQFTAAFGLEKKFAICLSPSEKSNGVIFFGNGPYVLQPGIDVSMSLTYTSLITNYFVKEYYLLLKAIKINGKFVPSDKWQYKLTFDYDKGGNGGTKIGTLLPYTVMESDIFSSVVDEFVKALGKNIPRVANVAPFDVCFNSTGIARSRLGPAVPTIELVFQNKAVWKIFGANSMVQAAKDVMCLAFVSKKEGFWSTAAIEIGGYLLEDNLIQFDLDNNRVGFSSSLLSKQTSCSNFKYTNHA